jgi:hypothetical protein
MAALTSYFIDRAAAEKAIGLVMPMIASAMATREAGESGFLYIVVMQPGTSPADSRFEEAILHEHAVGDTAKWDADYGAFARAKAKVAWKTGLDAHIVSQLKPHLLEQGDTVLSGGIVLDGIVVAVSGADPWYDELFAGTIAACLRAQAKAGIARVKEKHLFLPDRSGNR